MAIKTPASAGMSTLHQGKPAADYLDIPWAKTKPSVIPYLLWLQSENIPLGLASLFSGKQDLRF
jgi:hypothetical protein